MSLFGIHQVRYRKVVITLNELKNVLLLALGRLSLENSEKHKPKNIPNNYTYAFSIQLLQSDFLTYFFFFNYKSNMCRKDLHKKDNQ